MLALATKPRMLSLVFGATFLAAAAPVQGLVAAVAVVVLAVQLLISRKSSKRPKKREKKKRLPSVVMIQTHQSSSWPARTSLTNQIKCFSQ
jgi:membrane protein implicated in regulation of membrane protease activity